ncbi:uncharacterized protein LOC134079727 [Sardina pilchardus]|uniref:uncharacterized protein LOC134079727 n=1 Tax=Sardina pilchardus TaxID=27697 RepID=UPI002E1451CE
MASFCETHVSQHYTAPALQRHRLVEATGDLEQRLCPQHHRELEFYCRTDQTPVDPFPRGNLTGKQQLIEKGPPDCYLLPTEKGNIDEEGKVRRWTFGKRDASKAVKNILVVGETGTGKTTLINTIVNYILGVKRGDGVWFQITEEDKQKSQAKSQTTAITVYEVFVETSSLALRIIDTPGYGSTDGIEDDQKMPEKLHELFRSEDGIREINSVCLVVKTGCNRLTEFQLYIFDAILSLFGEDIKENIVVMITHSDGMSNDVFTALDEARVPYAKYANGEPLHFIFNNRQSKGYKGEDEDMFQKAWDFSYNNMEKFLVFLSDVEVKELNLTEEVLRERKRLEAIVSNLQDAIKMEELKQNELKQTQRALEENKEKCENNEDFTYEVDEPYKDKSPLQLPWWKFTTKATCCTICKENCHYPGCCS